MPTERSGPCLDEDAALAFLRSPRDDRAASTDAHLAGCADCRRLVLELARASKDLGRTDAPSDSAALTAESIDRLDLSDPAQRYTLLEPVGTGGMGVVHAAYDAKLDRKVALKLVRVEMAHETTGERFVREATTLARLSHPNIVSVYDVGRFDDVVYIAMELIEGTTLRGWLSEAQRPWREILRHVVIAGRGLAAAHEAGVVHRDFKPENVLVAGDGRVCVTDFGLARAATAPDDERVGDPTTTELEADTGLTGTGALIGTPSYLAPEQFDGQPASERSDQFSFCVTLYESLYGERPFRGSNLPELQAAVTSGRLEPPSRSGAIPQWLRRRIVRGLARDPADRYPSLAALLQDLERDPATLIWRVTAGAAGVTAVGLAFALGGWRDSEETRCPPQSPELEDAWGPDVRQAIQASFAAIERPYADTALDSVVGRIDAYTRDWNTMRVAACRATHESGEQSERLLDLRMQCLQRRLAAVRATTGLLTEADEELVSRAVDVVGALPSIDPCGDAEALQSVVPRPEGAAARAEFAELDAQNAEATALRVAGRFDRAAEISMAVVQRARDSAYDPMLADALITLGGAEHARGNQEAGEAALREAVLAADRGRHDDARAGALSTLAWIVGADPRRLDEAVALGQRSEAVLVRFGGAEDTRAALLDNLGIVYRAAGRLDEALDHHERALKIRRRILAADDPAVAITSNNVGAVLLDKGDAAAAAEHFAEALQIWERAYGGSHPQIAFALNNLAAASQDDVEQCIEYGARALTIREAALGKEHPFTAVSRLNLGLFRALQGEHALALADYESAHAVFAETMGKDHAYTVQALTQAGHALKDLGRYPEARERLETARTLAGDGSSGAPVDFIESTLGSLSLAEGDAAAALVHYEAARSLLEARPGQDPIAELEARIGIGRAQSALGRFEAAVTTLTGAIDIEPSSDTAATAKYLLAQALWSVGEQRPRARTLAAEARQHLARSDSNQEVVGEIDDWLDGLPSP